MTSNCAEPTLSNTGPMNYFRSNTDPMNVDPRPPLNQRDSSNQQEIFNQRQPLPQRTLRVEHAQGT